MSETPRCLTSDEVSRIMASYDPTGTLYDDIHALGETAEVLRGIVQRVQDGWWAPSDVDPDDADDYQPGWWIGTDGPEEPAPEPERMTGAEQIAWYGSVVRQGLEEEPTSALAKAVWRSRGGPPKPRPRGFA